MKHLDIRADITRVEGMVARVVEEGFDEDVLNMAQEKLSELKAASQRLLDHGDAALPALIASADKPWREYQARLKKAVTFLEPLV